MANRKQGEDARGDLLETVLDSIKDTVLVVDPRDFTIVMANNAFLEEVRMR